MFTSRRTDISVQDINNLPSREWQIIEQEKIQITFKNISPYSEGTVSQNRKNISQLLIEKECHSFNHVH